MRILFFLSLLFAFNAIKHSLAQDIVNTNGVCTCQGDTSDCAALTASSDNPEIYENCVKAHFTLRVTSFAGIVNLEEIDQIIFQTTSVSPGVVPPPLPLKHVGILRLEGVLDIPSYLSNVETIGEFLMNSTQNVREENFIASGVPEIRFSKLHTIDKIVIRESVTVRARKFQTLSLPELTSVNVVHIINIPGLTTISMPKLLTAGQMTLDGVPLLENVSFNKLSQVGNVNVDHNPKLMSFSAPDLNAGEDFSFTSLDDFLALSLPKLTSAKSITVHECAKMTSISFAMLNSMIDLNLSELDNLETLSFPNLKNANNLNFADLEILENINFPKLESLDSFIPEGILNLKTVSMDKLKTANTLEFRDLDELESISAKDLNTVSTFIINQCKKLLSGVNLGSSATTIGSSLEIFNNENLCGLTWFLQYTILTDAVRDISGNKGNGPSCQPASNLPSLSPSIITSQLTNTSISVKSLIFNDYYGPFRRMELEVAVQDEVLNFELVDTFVYSATTVYELFYSGASLDVDFAPIEELEPSTNYIIQVRACFVEHGSETSPSDPCISSQRSFRTLGDSTDSTSSSSIAPIAGGVVGGIALLILIAAIIVVFSRRRRTGGAASRKEKNTGTEMMMTSNPMKNLDEESMYASPLKNSKPASVTTANASAYSPVQDSSYATVGKKSTNATQESNYALVADHIDSSNAQYSSPESNYASPHDMKSAPAKPATSPPPPPPIKQAAIATADAEDNYASPFDSSKSNEQSVSTISKGTKLPLDPNVQYSAPIKGKR